MFIYKIIFFYFTNDFSGDSVYVINLFDWKRIINLKVRISNILSVPKEGYMLIDINKSKILKIESLNNLFKSAVLKDINESCKILNTEFYIDSFN